MEPTSQLATNSFNLSLNLSPVLGSGDRQCTEEVALGKAAQCLFTHPLGKCLFTQQPTCFSQPLAEGSPHPTTRQLPRAVDQPLKGRAHSQRMSKWKSSRRHHRPGTGMLTIRIKITQENSSHPPTQPVIDCTQSVQPNQSLYPSSVGVHLSPHSTAHSWRERTDSRKPPNKPCSSFLAPASSAAGGQTFVDPAAPASLVPKSTGPGNPWN